MEGFFSFLCPKNMKTAGQIIDTQLPTLGDDFDIALALRWMDECSVSELPIVVNGVFKGLISENQLLDIEGDETFIMPALSSWNIGADDHFFTMVHQFARYQTSIAPVISKDNTYLGCVTREDLVDLLNDMTSAHLDGGVVLLEMAPRDYTLQQIARIVEENDAKVLALFAYPNERGMTEVVLKLDVKNVNAIIRSLERFEYRVRATFQHPEANIDLLDRYDTLMRFLDVD